MIFFWIVKLNYYNWIITRLSNKMADYEDRYQDDEEITNTDDEDITNKLNDEYLCNVVKELLENCENIKKYFFKDINRSLNPYDSSYYLPRLIEWSVEDIDYDIKKCSKYCLQKYNSYYQEWESIMCPSCKKIINERLNLTSFIKKIICLENKNKEMQNTLIQLQKEIDLVKPKPKG